MGLHLRGARPQTGLGTTQAPPPLHGAWREPSRTLPAARRGGTDPRLSLHLAHSLLWRASYPFVFENLPSVRNHGHIPPEWIPEGKA